MPSKKSTSEKLHQRRDDCKEEEERQRRMKGILKSVSRPLRNKERRIEGLKNIT